MSQFVEMKIFTNLLTLFVFQWVLSASASDFLDEFERLKQAGDDGEIREFLELSAKDELLNPDYYASAGNYWWGISNSLSVTTKPSDSGEFSIQSKDSGEEVGSISNVGRVNPDIPKKALSILEEGARRFPRRADILLGLAHVQREMELRKECTKTLVTLLEGAKENPSGLTWTKNEGLPSPAAEFIPKAIQRYSSGFYKIGTAESDLLCIELCDATMAAFPDHPFAYNIRGAVALAVGKLDEGLQYLELAHQKAPDDPLILLNLGDTYRKAGSKEKAKGAYSKVLELDGGEGSHRAQAKAAILELEK